MECSKDGTYCSDLSYTFYRVRGAHNRSIVTTGTAQTDPTLNEPSFLKAVSAANESNSTLPPSRSSYFVLPIALRPLPSPFLTSKPLLQLPSLPLPPSPLSIVSPPKLSPSVDLLVYGDYPKQEIPSPPVKDQHSFSPTN